MAVVFVSSRTVLSDVLLASRTLQPKGEMLRSVCLCLCICGFVVSSRIDECCVLLAANQETAATTATAGELKTNTECYVFARFSAGMRWLLCWAAVPCTVLCNTGQPGRMSVNVPIIILSRSIC
jgi:hypothetical protein